MNSNLHMACIIQYHITVILSTFTIVLQDLICLTNLNVLNACILSFALKIFEKVNVCLFIGCCVGGLLSFHTFKVISSMVSYLYHTVPCYYPSHTVPGQDYKCTLFCQ